MQTSDRFSDLPPYAFPRLRALLDHHTPGGEPVAMSIGEPRHPFPEWVPQVISENAAGFGRYPPNDGSPGLLTAAAGWVDRRYDVTLDPEQQVMALNGTREGLYNVAMALCPETSGDRPPVVLLPNPFYQVYAVAALSVGAEPVAVPATAATGYLPDYAGLPADVLNRVELCYICSPSNPQGAVAPREYWAELIGLAERYDFRIIADECYAEIYRDAPPPGALETAAELGADPERVVVFHSLSKRSNLPGLRSGFVASGPDAIARMRKLRSYAGSPLPLPLQAVAERAWSDDAHVVENRRLYAEKFALADAILGDLPGYTPPEAGFFLWLDVGDGEAAALKLWRETGVRVLPGAYLGRGDGPANPGHAHIRVALVAPYDQTETGLRLIRDCLAPSAPT